MLKIWGRPNSINMQKVMWCVGELGLAHETIACGGAFGGNNEAWFLAMNPNGLIPVIDDDGFVLWESNAIVRYLAAKHGLGGLCPEPLAARADADRWMEWQATTIQPLLTPIFWGLVRTPVEQRNLAAIESAAEKLGKTFGILDKRLTGRRFILGERLTMADIALGAAAYRWYGLTVTHPPYHNLRAWYERLTGREPFHRHVMVPLT
jgi:glutathione S-transferase